MFACTFHTLDPMTCSKSEFGSEIESFETFW